MGASSNSLPSLGLPSRVYDRTVITRYAPGAVSQFVNLCAGGQDVRGR